MVEKPEGPVRYIVLPVKFILGGKVCAPNATSAAPTAVGSPAPILTSGNARKSNCTALFCLVELYLQIVNVVELYCTVLFSTAQYMYPVSPIVNGVPNNV